MFFCNDIDQNKNSLKVPFSPRQHKRFFWGGDHWNPRSRRSLASDFFYSVLASFYSGSASGPPGAPAKQANALAKNVRATKSVFPKRLPHKLFLNLFTVVFIFNHFFFCLMHILWRVNPLYSWDMTWGPLFIQGQCFLAKCGVATHLALHRWSIALQCLGQVSLQHGPPIK